LSIAAHARLVAEYLGDPLVPMKQELIRALDARGVRYAYADYWTAYYVTFMTRERIVVAADAVVKVRGHNRLVDAHRAEAIRISRTPCPGGQPLTPAFWACGT
jgi:IS1 family transposase